MRMPGSAGPKGEKICCWGGLSHVLLVGARGIAGLFEHIYEDLRAGTSRRPIDVKKLETKKD